MPHHFGVGAALSDTGFCQCLPAHGVRKDRNYAGLYRDDEKGENQQQEKW